MDANSAESSTEVGTVDGSAMLVFSLVSNPGSTGLGELVCMTKVRRSFTSMRSISSSTLVPGRRNNARSKEPLTFSASIETPLWNFTPSLKVITQAVDSPWTAFEANQGSVLRFPSCLNNVSAKPVGTANQPAW